MGGPIKKRVVLVPLGNSPASLGDSPAPTTPQFGEGLGQIKPFNPADLAQAVSKENLVSSDGHPNLAFGPSFESPPPPTNESLSEVGDEDDNVTFRTRLLDDTAEDDDLGAWDQLLSIVDGEFVKLYSALVVASAYIHSSAPGQSKRSKALAATPQHPR